MWCHHVDLLSVAARPRLIPLCEGDGGPGGGRPDTLELPVPCALLHCLLQLQHHQPVGISCRIRHHCSDAHAHREQNYEMPSDSSRQAAGLDGALIWRNLQDEEDRRQTADCRHRHVITSHQGPARGPTHLYRDIYKQRSSSMMITDNQDLWTFLTRLRLLDSPSDRVLAVDQIPCDVSDDLIPQLSFATRSSGE